jgi:hypothetical protein
MPNLDDSLASDVANVIERLREIHRSRQELSLRSTEVTEIESYLEKLRHLKEQYQRAKEPSSGSTRSFRLTLRSNQSTSDLRDCMLRAGKLNNSLRKQYQLPKEGIGDALMNTTVALLCTQVPGDVTRSKNLHFVCCDVDDLKDGQKAHRIVISKLRQVQS